MIPLCLLPGLLLAWADPPTKEDRLAPPSAYDVMSALQTVLSDAIAKAEPSVVAIHREKVEGVRHTLAVRGRKERIDANEFRADNERTLMLAGSGEGLSTDYGSGVVIGDEGQILTAFHVVKNATQLVVRAADRQAFLAEVIAADPRSDLAVIAPKLMPGRPGPRLKPLVIGDASGLRKGHFLVVLGNPFNAARDGRPSASWGILSNLARRLEFDEATYGRLQNHPTLMQLDAKLNLGMSGGAVINMKGELVGLTTLASSPEGYDSQAGYAVPMDKLVRRAVDRLAQGKEVEYGLLGLTWNNGMGAGSSNIVESVTANGPAEQAGLRIRDEIISIDGIPVTDFDSLILTVNAHGPGDIARLKVKRNNEVFEKQVELAKFPVKGEVIATTFPTSWRGLRVDYESTQYGVRSELNAGKLVPGVVISMIDEGSPALVAGLKKGQMITKVGNSRVTNPRAFADAVAGLEGPVKLETDLGPVTVP